MKAKDLMAITIHQPHAWAAASGHKQAENRSWQSWHRGWLLIHAGKSFEWLEPYGITKRSGGEAPLFGDEVGGLMPIPASLVRAQMGHVIGAARMTDCLTGEEAKRIGLSCAHGPYCFRLEDAFLFPEMVPCVGQQMIFRPPAEVAARCLAMINARLGGA